MKTISQKQICILFGPHFWSHTHAVSEFITNNKIYILENQV